MRASHGGFTLIELVVTMAIVGILLTLAAPSYQTWINNTRIRTTAESIQNGLQLARGEAVRRNVRTLFQLTDNIGGSCVLSTTASNWVVSLDAAAGACAAALLNDEFPITDATNNPAPRIIQVRPAAEGSDGVIVAAGQDTVTFNGLGRATSATIITVGDCNAQRCLRVTVALGGQIRMCDPAHDNTNDSQRCI